MRRTPVGTVKTQMRSALQKLKRVLKDADQYGVTSDANSRARFKLEIEANERDLATYNKRIEEYREITRVDLVGALEKEVQVDVDKYKMAAASVSFRSSGSPVREM